ncbi:hypothetical protein [Paeniglutamicibacter cryotolerans]|uniref:Uncharacterized protein n=1 Tax=Paeniglutamicibacter cryotolerans TaxID=670079 RepID=A0A839QG80_9MICC|nr:hypothetical protein [Paeniglutamicibacter cryotolerans]MBB2994623.1 hypothetical protein [Paeniglutamicibacter cryotolerans]
MQLAQQPMSLGADILLARHGDFIVELRHDRKADVMVARLRDGSADWAPNSLGGANAMPATVPVARMHQLADDFAADKLPFTRSELRFLVKVSLAWAAVAAVLAGGMTLLAMNMGNTWLVESMHGAGF